MTEDVSDETPCPLAETGSLRSHRPLTYADDVTDYRDVDPRIGTLNEFQEMVTGLTAAGIQTIIDIVPNHSSSEHPWFQEALASAPGSAARARYHFMEGESRSYFCGWNSA